MNTLGKQDPRPSGRLERKRQALIDGALTVFARDGYARASIDEIAQTAQVSTRTLYNHFGSKAGLFEVVIQESATRVARARTALIEQHLGNVHDLEADLTALGMAFAAPRPEFAEHFAMVRQINAEIGHIPQKALNAWKEAGPLRVQRALADHLNRLAQMGMLEIAEPELAALHLLALMNAPSSSSVADENPAFVRRAAHAGVRVFLKGYSAGCGKAEISRARHSSSRRQSRKEPR